VWEEGHIHIKKGLKKFFSGRRRKKTFIQGGGGGNPSDPPIPTPLIYPYYFASTEAIMIDVKKSKLYIDK